MKSSDGSRESLVRSEFWFVSSEDDETDRWILKSPLGDDSDRFSELFLGSESALAEFWSLLFVVAEDDTNGFDFPLDSDFGTVRGKAGVGVLLSAIRTPDGPSTIPKLLAARMKYCIVVPVLLVLFAFKACSVSFRVCGTNLQ